MNGLVARVTTLDGDRPVSSRRARVPPHRRAAPGPRRHRVPPSRPPGRRPGRRPRARPSVPPGPARDADRAGAHRRPRHLPPAAPSHLAQLRAIIDDPEASANDRFVATDLLRNACVSAGGVLPMCQDTGTVIVVGKRTEAVLTGGDDEEAISRGVFEAYESLNLRYSQMAPTSFWDERNTGTNLPAQVELYSVPGAAPTLRVAGDGQGRRVGEQDLPLPGDQGAAEPEAAGDLPRREAALAGHGGVPALPPGDRRRRDVGGVHPQGREAGVGALPGHDAASPARRWGKPSATAAWSSRCWS